MVNEYHWIHTTTYKFFFILSKTTSIDMSIWDNFFNFSYIKKVAVGKIYLFFCGDDHKEVI